MAGLQTFFLQGGLLVPHENVGGKDFANLPENVLLYFNYVNNLYEKNKKKLEF
jgi:hypothetical protein